MHNIHFNFIPHKTKNIQSTTVHYDNNYYYLRVASEINEFKRYMYFFKIQNNM